MVIVGLMGGIGHGKTSFAQFLNVQSKHGRSIESSDLIIEVANALRHESPKHPQPTDTAGINRWLQALPDILRITVHCPVDFNKLALSPAKLKNNPLRYAKLLEYLEIMQAEPAMQTVEIDARNKQQFRSLLQWLGGYLVKNANEGIWFDEIIRRIRLEGTKGLELATVCAVRFTGDAERIRNAGGYIVEVRREAAGELDPTEVTERERSLIKPDSSVANNGSLAELNACAVQVYKDLIMRELKPHYEAVR